MKKKIKLFGLILLTLAIFACKQREQIVMETYESAITIYINTDVENISIDWGDEKKADRSYEKDEYFLKFRHLYSDETLHTIVITADSLKILDCNNNRLTNLDVSKCPKLKYLICHENQLKDLDVRNCPKLTGLTCHKNQLKDLDVSKCLELIGLICGENQLTSLDVSKCPELIGLDCSKNQLTSLDVSKCPKLNELKHDDNVTVLCLTARNDEKGN
jgi:hypothetical protein